MQMLMTRTVPRTQERAIVQSIEDDVDLVAYESGRPMSEVAGIEQPRTLERSAGTAMPSVPNSVGGVQGKTTTASSSKDQAIRLAGINNPAFVQRGVKRKSQELETPRKKVQKLRPQGSNNTERRTQNRNLMPPPPPRRAAVRAQKKNKDLMDFCSQSAREVSQALQEGRAAPIISCHCNQSNCRICSVLNSRDYEE